MYKGVGVSGMKFIGMNATLLIYNGSRWFALGHSSSVTFSGLTMILNESVFTINLFNVSNVNMTNIRMESVCSDFITLAESTGSFLFHNVTTIQSSSDKRPCSVYMNIFSNVRGVVTVSGSRFYFLDPFHWVGTQYGVEQ